MISGSSVVRKYIAWYDFRILCHKTVHAWYDFRILCHKNVHTWIPEYVSLLWVSWNVFLHPLATFCKYGISSQNDYHSKNRVEIMCKNPVRMPRYLFPRPDILAYFWNHRTLVWMFTWPDWHLCPIGPIALNFQRLPDCMVCPIDRLLSPDWDRLGVRRPE